MSEKMAARDLTSRMRQFEMEAKLKSGNLITSEVDDHIDADNKRKNVQLNRKLKAFDQECKVSLNLIDREIQSVKRFQQQIISQRKSTSPPTEGERLRKISASSAKLPPITERRRVFSPDSTEPDEGAYSARDEEKRPSARSSISWTPGVNEASAKRIRERVLQSLDQDRKQLRSHSLGDHCRPSVDSLLPSSSKSFDAPLKLRSDPKPRQQRASTGSVPYPSSKLNKKTPSPPNWAPDAATNASAQAYTNASANASKNSSSSSSSKTSSPTLIRERAKERVRKRASTIARLQSSVDHQFVQSQPLDQTPHYHQSSETPTSCSPTPNVSSTHLRKPRAATINSLPLPRNRSSASDSLEKTTTTTTRPRASTDVDQLLGPRNGPSTLNELDRLWRKPRRESSTSSSSGSLEKGWKSQETLVLFPTSGSKMPTGKPLLHHKSVDRLAVEH